MLERSPDTAVVAGIDPAPSYDVAFPVHSSLDDGLGAEPDVVVVATPTDSHVEIVDRLLGTTTTLVLSEKPLAQTSGEIAALE